MTTTQQTIDRLETELHALQAERDHLRDQLRDACARLSAVHSVIHAPTITAAERIPRTRRG